MNEARARNLLAQLPEKFRSVVILREIEAMSYDDIARTLKIPLGRVKIMLFRARKKNEGGRVKWNVKNAFRF
ncbi:MAG: hypothetical protein CVU78_06140 [Elusimicrobia bacterium HGW-Elusimicrobia-2]|nr:MAG: hypothetical protein CVU78_06140 [Elusimicrobia bacterium HGW-Elusimicrobia-2]